jgi:hypothetical protein
MSLEGLFQSRATSANSMSEPGLMRDGRMEDEPSIGNRPWTIAGMEEP